MCEFIRCEIKALTHWQNSVTNYSKHIYLESSIRIFKNNKYRQNFDLCFQCLKALNRDSKKWIEKYCYYWIVHLFTSGCGIWWCGIVFLPTKCYLFVEAFGPGGIKDSKNIRKIDRENSLLIVILKMMKNFLLVQLLKK